MISKSVKLLIEVSEEVKNFRKTPDRLSESQKEFLRNIRNGSFLYIPNFFSLFFTFATIRDNCRVWPAWHPELVSNAIECYLPFYTTCCFY